MGVQKLILGTVQLGLDYGINNTAGKPTTEAALELLAFAQAAGITTLDTAAAYGNANELIGLYHQSSARRFEVINKIKGAQEDVRKSLTTTLQQLDIPAFEVLHFHAYQDFVSYPELTAQLLAMKSEGKIRKMGISIYSDEEMEGAIDRKEIDVIQFPFNLLDNNAHRLTHIKRAKDAGKELHVRSVYLQGLFFKDLDTIPVKLQPLLPYLKTIRSLSSQSGFDIQTIALNYALQQAGIDKVIIGVDSREQLAENIACANTQLTDSLLREIDQIQVQERALLSPVNWQ